MVAASLGPCGLVFALMSGPLSWSAGTVDSAGSISQKNQVPEMIHVQIVEKNRTGSWRVL